MRPGDGPLRAGLAAVPMIVQRDLPVPMDDGLVLRADVFRPEGPGPVPVIMSLGPYGKGLPFSSGWFAARWERLLAGHPEITDGSSCVHMNWETVDPKRWVPHGYAVVRVDSRGAGRSPGLLDLLSAREIRDFHLAIEWAGDTALEHRTGRPVRYLVLCHQPVAGGGDPATAPGRHPALGGR